MLKRAVREQQSLFNASVVLIEDKASGTQLIQDLIEDGCHGVTRYQPTGDKTMRMHAQTAVIENGFVRIPETAPWLASHDDVNALDLTGVDDAGLAADLERSAAGNLKRVVRPQPRDFTADPGLKPMTALLETKTVWHPKGF